MKLFSVVGAILALPGSEALRIPFTSRSNSVSRPKAFVSVLPGHPQSIANLLSSSSSSDGDDIGNVDNIRYTTNITLNGKEIHVALDTGSTDLWVIPPDGLGTFNDTHIPLTLRYGDGSYGVKGTIGFAPFQFGPYRVEEQVFLNASMATISSLAELGIHGLLGLAFSVPRASPILAALSASASFGPAFASAHALSPIENIFRQHPDTPNYLTILLSRSGDRESTAGGAFTIGELSDDTPALANVTAAPKLAQFPDNSTRWTTLLSSITIKSNSSAAKSIPLNSTISSTPKGQTVALLDTGSPFGAFPEWLVDALYSSIEGSVKDELLRTWIAPCLATPEVEFIFGSQHIPIHPLDLTEPTFAFISGVNHTLCTNAISAVSADDFGGGEFDVVLGDTFLRNVYSLYDFGSPTPGPTSETEQPFIQLLPLTAPNTANAELLSARTKTIAETGPELPPAELLKLLIGGDTSSTSSAASSSATAGANTNPKTKTNAGIVNLAADSSNTIPWDELVSKYAPALLGILALNTIVLLVLLALAVLGYVRRPSVSRKAYVPVRVKKSGGSDESRYGGYVEYED